jgi:activating signal cointegrator 1
VDLGHKSVETRCWSTKYRGELAIHSAAKLPAKWLGASRHEDGFRDALADIFNARRDRDERTGFHVDDAIKALPLGKVLCIVRLVDIQDTGSMDCCELPETERLFGNYENGRYAWFLEMVERFETPIMAKGNRMLWNWERQCTRP